MEKISWEEFLESKLLWWVNMQLHLFGITLVVETLEDGTVHAVYPARTKYRGFSENENDAGYEKLTKYLANNIKQLQTDTLS